MLHKEGVFQPSFSENKYDNKNEKEVLDVKKNLFLELESKMVQKEVIEFKMDSGQIEKFSIDKKFLNTKISEMLFEYADIITYAKENDMLQDIINISGILLVKYFVRQIYDNKEVEIFKPEKTIKSNFETLIATSSALANIENVEGKSLLEVFMDKLGENGDNMKLLQEKIKQITTNVVNNKENILRMVEQLNKVGEENETV